MLNCLSVKMIHLLVLCPVLLAAGVQTLTIDSQLGTSIEDCFERISIGEQLPADNIYRNVTELTTRECEQICKQDKQCQSYDYGVGAKGNATCNLGNSSETDIKEKNLLIRHPDYDVYVRRFQCEQSPPSPIEPQFDEPIDTHSEDSSDKPTHRPVFRPADEKQTYSNDYLVSSDLGSYGVQRPVYKPQYDERPDDYTNQKPDYDSGPSYGSHKPQDTPFNPPKPVKNPNHSTRPDPYDVSQLQDSERPNDKPEYPSNDNNKPYKRPYVPEKPEYVYVTHRRPKPQTYGFENKPIYDDLGHGSSASRPHNDDYYRPRPTTPGQYASGYGQNVPYDNNYIHVEIIDPPRPYDRPKPSDQGYYGYGSYASQNSYTQSQNSHSQQYAAGNAYGNNQYTVKPGRPDYGNPVLSDEGYKPRPGYKKPYSNQVLHDSNDFNTHNSFSSNQASYGSNHYEGSWHKPSYHKPTQVSYGEGGSHGNQGSYVNDQIKPSYDNDEGGYGVKPTQNDPPSYGNKPYGDEPLYGTKPSYNKPSYDSRPPYSGNKPLLADDQPSYGNKPLYDSNRPPHGGYKPLYNDQPSYNNEPNYGSNRPSNRPDNDYPVSSSGSYGQGAYGGSQYFDSQATYGSSSTSHSSSSHHSHGSTEGSYSQNNYLADQGSYGASNIYGGSQNDYNKPSFGPNRPLQDVPPYGGSRPSQDKPSYGGNRPLQDQPSYGSNLPSHDVPSYGGNRPSQDEPSYGGSRPSHDEPGYDSSRPSHDEPSYGNNRPSQDEPSYGGNRPSYDKPTYGGSRPLQDQSSYGGSRPSDDDPSYGGSRPSNDEPSYGGSRPSHDKPSYGGSRPLHDEPSYGGSQPSHDEPSYGGSRPSHDEPSYGGSQPSHDEASYGGSRPSHDEPSYGGSRPSHDEPSYGGSRPSHDKPSYGAIRPSHDEPSYGGSRPSHDEPSYGGSQSSHYEPLYGSHRPSHDEPSYGGSRPSHDEPSYGGSRPSHDELSYGGSRPSHDEPSYGSHRPSHDEPSYGGSRPSHDEPSYGGSRPSHDEPSYGGSRPSHDEPSYGGHRPSHDEPSYGGSRPSHEEPSYGSNRPSHDEPSYGGSRPSHDEPSYGGNRPLQDQPSYNQKPQKPKPVYGQNDDSNQGYGYNRPGFDDDRPDYINPAEPSSDTESGYGSDKPNKAGIKPVYEYELEKPQNVPSYIARPGGEIVTSRPVAIGDFIDSDYRRDPGRTTSYEACFRRVLAGKRTLRSYVRKVVSCERLEDCRRECATEKRFPCESFNYRLDRGFNGQGLCELMTKPIEAFDPVRDFVEDKDFDFYELDRNSLEPNCPDTLRGPGLLHSGFLSSKTTRVPERESGWKDRDDWNDGRRGDRFKGNRRGNHGNRYDGKFYIPYQINHGLARSSEDESWGQYGGAYGGNERYYKDRNDYHKSVTHWRLSDDHRPSYGVKPYESVPTIPTTNFDYNTLAKSGGDDSWSYGYGTWKRGRWNNSGNNGLEHEESNFYKPKPHFHGVNERGHDPIARSNDEPIKDCSSRRRPGMSLGTGAIRRSLISRNVVECEAACFSERQFKCVSYSFRYSSTHGVDNCFLSERPYRGLELSADSGSDVYAMPQDQGCVTINSKPWVESECFWHVRSGAAVTDSAARAALTVAGLGACEAECIRAHTFFCRGFSFRFDSPTIGDDLENCILTSSPPTSLDIGRGLRPNGGHELYSRGNYGRGCEPALYDDAQSKDEECYLQYDKAAKLTPSAIRGRARVKDEQSCGHACNEAPFTCLSFSYNNNAPPNTDNCLLSEIRLFDLQRGVDYIHSADDWLFAFDLFNGQCWRKVHSSHMDDSSPEIPRPLSAPPVEDPYSFLEPSGPGITGPSGPSGPSFSSSHHELPFGPSGPPSGPGFKPEPHRHPPGHHSDYPEPSKPIFKPHDPSRPKPQFSGPSGPDYKPRPHFKPEYIDETAPDFKPGFSGPNFEPGFSEPSGPDFKPGPLGPNQKPYSRPSGPDFKPNYPDPSGPTFKPGYPGQSFKPGFSEPSKPDFKPALGPSYPQSGHGIRPDYIDTTSNHKPAYPGPIAPNYKPEFSDPDPNFNPNFPPSSRPGSYHPDNIKPVFRPGPERPYRPEHDYIPGKPDYLPEKPGYLQNHRPGYPGPNRPLADVPKPGGRPGYTDGESNQPIKASWRHYTVSGFPCRSGTTCAQNHIAGHWACEPEGGEIGSWDYCCAPSHRCGYSEGFHKPWCYVGPAEDQWRPCSEKYYPYHQHNVPHPSQGNQNSQGNRESDRLPQRPWNRPAQPSPPVYEDRPQGPSRPTIFDRPHGPYLSEADRRYWDDLYKNGPQAYYDKYGNPLPGYSRVPPAERPYTNPNNYPRPGNGPRQQHPQESGDGPPSTLGVPRYWPVAYLHKGPPPNTTYFRYNETDNTSRNAVTTTTERPTTTPREQHSTTDQPNNVDRHRDVKQRNISEVDDIMPEVTTVKPKPTTTVPISTTTMEVKPIIRENKTEVKTVRPITVKVKDAIKGIDDKLDDFSRSIEIFDLDDVKLEKSSDIKTLEAEEKQIEEIGRILASRRGGKLVLDNKTQKDLENKNIAVDKELIDFNFGNRFNVDRDKRRGIIQKVTKEEIERERAGDKSLELSETTFVRPPRILPTIDNNNIRKALVNGKVFFDATVREQRDAFRANSTRKAKNLRNADESRILNLTSTANFGKKTVIARNVNPVRRVRRVFKKRYNPDEVRRRLLEKEKSKQDNTTASSKSA